MKDYEALGAWCRRLRGQGMVCEAEGAAWLSFRPFAELPAMHGAQRSREVIWTSGVEDQAELFT